MLLPPPKIIFVALYFPVKCFQIVNDSNELFLLWLHPNVLYFLKRKSGTISIKKVRFVLLNPATASKN
jgi:hypothetical protein